MRTSRAQATGVGARLGRMAEPLTEMKDRLTDAVGNAQDRFEGARDSAVGTIAERPLRWTIVAFVAGLIVGVILENRR